MKQPKNILAPWGVNTDNGGYVGIDDDGLLVSTIKVGLVKFPDGSTMVTAGSGLPSTIDSGQF
jgi:hypothetical protein